MSANHQEFWRWFSQHEGEYFRLDPTNEPQREKLFDLLSHQLSRIDVNLTFELGPPQPVREFVISAGGIRSSFPEVTALTQAAPRLDRWQVIAFRPRRTPMAIQIGGKCIEPAGVAFTLLDNGTKAGINLFLPGFKDDDISMKQIGYLLLDEALGEYDVETGLGLIRMLPAEARTDGERFPLAKLPAEFDRLMAKLQNKSQKPS